MISSASNLTQSTITVLPLQHAERSLMLEIIHAAYVEYEGKLTPPSGAHNETIQSLATKLIHGEGALAWDGIVAVGSVLFEPRGDALYLGRLAVPPQHRRHGIGARLAAYVEAQAVARGHNQITLGVRLRSPAGIQPTCFNRWLNARSICIEKICEYARNGIQYVHEIQHAKNLDKHTQEVAPHLRGDWRKHDRHRRSTCRSRVAKVNQ